MKRIAFLALLSIWLALPAMAQEKPTFGTLGLGYGDSPHIIGWGMLGYLPSPDGKTMAYSSFISSITKDNPQVVLGGLKLTIGVQQGLIHNFYETGKWSLWGMASPGAQLSTTDIKSSFQYGALIRGKKIIKSWGLEIPVGAQTIGGVTKLALRIGLSRSL